MATAKKTAVKTTAAAKKVAVIKTPIKAAPVLKDVYVSFSCFPYQEVYIIATLKQQTQQQIDDLMNKSFIGFDSEPAKPAFSLVNVKRPCSKSVELYFNLLNNKDGQPTKSRTKVVQAFSRLEKLGWLIDKENFVNFHWA